jgi:hypothetical protein
MGMTSPGQRLCFMMMYLSVVTAVLAAVNFVVDPFGVWGVSVIDRVYLKSEPGERSTTPYRLRSEQPTTLLVGSSRVLFGMLIEQGYRDGVLNAGVSHASLDEIAGILQAAIGNRSLKRVVWGVDFFAFDENWTGFRDPQAPLRLQRNEPLMIAETLFSLDALDASRKLLFRAIGGRDRLPATRRAPVPWPEELIREKLDGVDEGGLGQADDAVVTWQLMQWAPSYATYRYSANQLMLFRSTMERVQAAGIDVVLFVPPLSGFELEVIRQTGHWQTFQRWQRELVAVAPYWDFSGYSALSRSDGLFIDIAHFKPAIGHLILRDLLGQGCSRCGQKGQLVAAAAQWVDPATLDAHLREQDASRMAHTREESRYSRIVAEVLRGNRGPLRPSVLHDHGMTSGSRAG